jgi:hypothetical protein
LRAALEHAVSIVVGLGGVEQSSLVELEFHDVSVAGGGVAGCL